MYYHPPKPQKKQPKILYIVATLLSLFLIWFLSRSPANQPTLAPPAATVAVQQQPIQQQQVLPLPPQETNLEKITTIDKPIVKPEAVVITKHVFETQQGDSASSVFSKAHLPQKLLVEILQDIKHGNLLDNIKPKQSFIFSLQKDRLLSIEYNITAKKYLLISATDDEHYRSQLIQRKVTTQNHYLSATISGSLYETAINNHIPYKLMLQLAKIFSRKVNFSKDLRNNDKFSLIYQTEQVADQPEIIGKVLAASFTNRNKTYTALKYNNGKGRTGYFTPEGHSLKLGFDRFPIKFHHISSHYNPNRMHPILERRRPHRGIDLAARYGTPIKAVADGIVSHIGPNSGYGNMVKIKHSDKYETIYAHMSKFKVGLKRHAKVKRGQVIGYVGQTGLATAPHCHFEFRVFGKPRDPARVALPKSPGLTGKQLAEFKQQTKVLLAQLINDKGTSFAAKSADEPTELKG